MYRLRQGVRLVLASGSPRRQEFLQRLGLEFLPCPAQSDESLLPGEEAGQAALRLAQLKAQAVAPEWPQAAVLAADTLVALERHILGKPADLAEARGMLALLSGQEHQVVTGYCLIWQGRQDTGRVVSRVRFRELSPAEIAAYAASGEPLGKAGAYAVQGLGAALVESVHGSYSNVVGLPLAQVVELLLRRGIVEPDWEVPS